MATAGISLLGFIIAPLGAPQGAPPNADTSPALETQQGASPQGNADAQEQGIDAVAIEPDPEENPEGPLPPSDAQPSDAPTDEALPSPSNVREESQSPPAPPLTLRATEESEKSERARRDSIFEAGYGTRGQVTIAIGGMADALDPRAAAGASLRVPQFTSDARFGLGSGWSAILHLNTILAINELDVGVNWSFPIIGELRGLAQFQTGISLGMLGSFGFQSTVLAPEFRPLIGLSVPAGSLRWSLRGEIIFAGPYFATLGEVTNTLATPPPIANWNVGIVLENLLRNNHLWYAGVLMMASTATYQNWLLFPDTSHYDYYPRFVGGYEF